MNIDWTIIVVSFIAAVPPTLAGVVAAIVGLRAARKVEEVHRATNSMKDALIAAALVEGHAAGVKSEKARKSRR